METDEQNGVTQSTERQRFYIELVPGETTIVSWKKLVKEAAKERERERDKEKKKGMEMDMKMESERETEREREREGEKQKERERIKNQSGCESSRICLGGDSDGGQYKDLFFEDLRTEYVDKATSSGHKRQKKQRINVPKLENQTNDDHSSIKHAGPEAVSAKVTDKATDMSNETFRHSTLPAIINDNQRKKLQVFNVDSPMLTYSRRSARKSEYPPLNALETAPVFPLKIMHDTLPKTEFIENSAVEKSRMKLRIGFDPSDIMHQNLKGRYEPVKINPMLLHDDESDGSRKLIDASPPGYQSFINGSGGDSDSGQYKDLFFKDLRTEYVDKATSSGHKRLKKQRINVPKLENQTNDDHSSIKHAGPEAVSAKRSARKSEYPPLNALETAPVFPLKIMHDTLPKTEFIEKSAVEKSRMKLRTGFDMSDIMHKNLKGRCENVKINPMLLHDDESDGSRKLIDASPPGYQSFINGSIIVLAATEDTLLERPFVKALESAIAELEVAVSRRRSFQSEALDARAPWFVIQKALPPEVLLKFGRVASIVRSAKETLSEDLVNRLVTILRQLVPRNTLKLSLRKLVMLNLFVRKGEAERFEDIKTEILSLVCHQQVGVAHFPEAKEKQISGGAYNLDDAVEDKLCDLYELCFQELPQHTDVQVLKLFIELAELWPEVIMDHHKLTNAISRAKERRAIAENSRGQNVVDDVMTIPDRVPSQKGKVIASTDNDNPITSHPRKTAPKRKNSCPSSTGVKSPLKQKRKQLISEKKNLKVKFVMKGKHETVNSIEKTTEDQANP